MYTNASTSSVHEHAQPDDSVIKDIHQALRNLGGETTHKRTRLKRLTTLRSSCLIKTYLEQHPSKQVHHAFKAVLTTVLDTLETENPKYALLLGWRFWKGSSINEILTEGHEFLEQHGPMSERQLFAVQREAITLFAGVFAELEDMCNKDFAQVAPPIRSKGTNHVMPSIEDGQENDLTYTASPIPPPDVPSTKDRPTGRELQMLIAYSRGIMPDVIAQIFSITEKTVRTHLQNIRGKLGTQTSIHAFWLAQYYGLLKPYEADALLAIQNFFEARRNNSSQE